MERAEQESLYQQVIVQRARTPHHAGTLDPADAAGDGNNPFCGDRVHITLCRAPDGSTARVRHQTRGCAICIASADLMAETVPGLHDDAISSLFERFDGMLRNGFADSGDARLGLLNAFENLHEYRSRIRCATLPWAALLDALKSERTL